MITKCPKGTKSCTPLGIYPISKIDLICAGRNKAPHFKCDKMKLCLRSKHLNSALELTVNEGLWICGALQIAISKIIERDFKDAKSNK